MLLSRGIKGSLKKESTSGSEDYQTSDFISYIEKRDYTGALTLLEFSQKKNVTFESLQVKSLWKAFCHFRLGEYDRSNEIYQQLSDSNNQNKSFLNDVKLFYEISKFYNGQDVNKSFINDYDGQYKSLAKRFFAYLEIKNFNDDSGSTSADSDKSLTLLDRLLPAPRSLEDDLCVAAIHFSRHHYQEAIDIYKKILLEHKQCHVVNVYIALCYYRLDYYDVSQELLSKYLFKYPNSIIAGNLRACNNYRLFNGNTAETELRNLIDSFPANFTYAKDLIRHNLVVFRGGEGAFQVLPLLHHSISEARLNMIIYYLKNDKIDDAHELLTKFPDDICKLPLEFIVKAIILTNIGQREKNLEYLEEAQTLFQLIGSSPAECDTIQGRQCMASYFFLLSSYKDVVLYLSSIKTYFYNDDTFNFNYGQAKAKTFSYQEGEEAFLLIENDKLRNDIITVFYLTRCYIMNRKANKAWDLFLKHQHSKDANLLLHLIANDAYKTGQFFIALRAFDILEKIDKNPENWEGKRGSAVGVFQLVIAKELPIEQLHETIRLLRTSSHGSQANQIINIMKTYSPEAH